MNFQENHAEPTLESVRLLSLIWVEKGFHGFVSFEEIVKETPLYDTSWKFQESLVSLLHEIRNNISQKPRGISNRARAERILPTVPSFMVEDAHWKNIKELPAQLAFVIYYIDKEKVEGTWHLLIPGVLTLLQDHEPPNKIQGVACLHMLLKKTGSAWQRQVLANFFGTHC